MRVREIFKTYLRGKGKIKPGEIARRLNQEKIPAAHGGPWTAWTVLGVLTYPKYAGRLVWGCTTQRLRTKVTRLPVRNWVTREGAFEPVIDPRSFFVPRLCLGRNCGRRIPDRDLIRAVRRVLAKYGRVSERLMGRKTGLTRSVQFTDDLEALNGFTIWLALIILRLYSNGQETTRTRDGILRRILEMLTAIRVISPAE